MIRILVTTTVVINLMLLLLTDLMTGLVEYVGIFLVTRLKSHLVISY